MVLNRMQFFLLLFFIVISPFVGHTLWWLAHSEKTMGAVWYQGKSYTGQLVHEYSAIQFIAGQDTSWFNTSDNIIFKKGEPVPVRYHPTDLRNAKVDIFIEIWGAALIYGGELTIILVIIFLHPSIIPRRSKVKLAVRKPFLQTVYNT